MGKKSKLVVSLEQLREARVHPSKPAGPCSWGLIENSPRYVEGVGVVFEGASETEFPDELLDELAEEPDRMFFHVRAGTIPVTLERARAAYQKARREGRARRTEGVRRAFGPVPPGAVVPASTERPEPAAPDALGSTAGPDRFTPRRRVPDGEGSGV